MPEFTKTAIRDVIDGQWPGEWGTDPNPRQPSTLAYRSTNLDDSGHLIETAGVYRAIPESKLRTKRLFPGDVLLEASGGTPGRPVGRVGLFTGAQVESAICANFLRVLRPKKHIDGSFLRWTLTLLHRRPEIWRYQQQTTGMSNLKVADYLRHCIDLPDSNTQTTIADILATIDDAIEQTEALIAKTQQIKAGLMHDLFTRGVTPNGELRPPRSEAPQLYKQSPLGWIPKEWEIGRCGELFEVQLGKMMSPAASAGPNQRPYLRNQNVYWDRLDLSDVATMHFSNDDMPKYRLRPGDLLACEGRFIGRCAIWRGEIEDCYYQKALHRLRTLDDRTTTQYMQFFMSLRFEFEQRFC